MKIILGIVFISLSLVAVNVRAFDMGVIKDELPAPVVEVEPDDYYSSKGKLLSNAASGKLHNHMYIGFYNSRDFEDKFPHQLYGILSKDYGMKIDFSQYKKNREVTWCSGFVNQKISQVIYALSEATFYNKFEPGVSFKNQVTPSWIESPYKFLDRMKDQDYKSKLMSSFQSSYSSVIEDCSETHDGKEFLSAFRVFLQDLGSAMDGYVKIQYDLMVAERDEVANKKIAQETAALNRSANVQKCFSQDSYNLYSASHSIVVENQKIKNAKKQLSKQDEIGRVSGAVNLSEKNRLGAILVEAESLRKKFFQDYKKYGGMASSPEKVVATDNPCKL